MISKRKQALQKQLFGFSGTRSVGARALKIAKSNRRKLKSVQEGTSVDTDTGLDVLNATALVQYFPYAGISGKHEQTIVSFEVHGIVRQNLASALIDDYRIDYILDRDPEGQDITAIELYLSATPLIDVYVDFDERKRFKVLRSFRGALSSNEGSNSFRRINFKVNLNMKAWNENEGSASIGSQSRVAIYMIHWTTASANQPTYQAQSRMISHD